MARTLTRGSAARAVFPHFGLGVSMLSMRLIRRIRRKQNGETLNREAPAQIVLAAISKMPQNGLVPNSHDRRFSNAIAGAWHHTF